MSGYELLRRKALRRDLECRLRQIEVAEIRSGRIEIWVDRGDGSVCGPRGERLARQALYHAHPHGRACGGGLVLVIDAQDALL